jgi:SAM-dependent methyltransferase
LTTDDPELASLRQRLDAEETAYAELLAAVDRVVQFPLPLERLPEQPELMQRLNTLCEAPPTPSPGGLWGRVWGRMWSHLAPRLERQQEFNAALVRMLNGQMGEGARLHAHLRDLAMTLVRYFQRLLPLVDARDRLSSALTTTRSELILEAFDRRQEALARRIDGLLALRDRLEAVAAATQAVTESLAAQAPPPAVAATARRAAEDAAYVAFENRFRGSQEEISERLTFYVDFFRQAAPVIDLGCGRGEFLDLLRTDGIAASGVDGNASCVAACRARGHEVVLGDLVEHLRAQGDASIGGLFAAQVAEHLPPRALADLLREAARVLRKGGLLVLETVNPRSVVAFVDIYTRDLTHERPLHPETLRFLAAAAGFSDVRIEWRSPVDPSSRLAPIPADALPPMAVQRMNENVERLNALLYAPQEYALVARR